MRWMTPAESWQLGGKFDPGNCEKRSAGLLGLVYIRIGSDLLCLREDGESVFFFFRVGFALMDDLGRLCGMGGIFHHIFRLLGGDYSIDPLSFSLSQSEA